MPGIKTIIFNYFRNHMPPLSPTEQIALYAGDIWWEAELLNGKPDWQQLDNIPNHSLTQAEKNFLENEAEELCKRIDDWKLVREGKIDNDLWEFIKNHKFWGISISKDYGGLGFSAVAHSAIISKIASRSLSIAVATMVPNSLGPAELIQHYGTFEQKEHYLKKLAEGKEIPCFALTGPEIGSDASNIPDKGYVCYGDYQNEKVLGIKLSWEKRYITLAPIATVLGLAFKLYDPEHLLGNKENIGITLCLIPTNHPGVEIGQHHLPAGLAFPNGPTSGKDVFIPIDWVIGGKEMVGEGWRMMMESLSVGRGISLPSLSAGSSQLCFRTTSAYAKLRKQFKRSIGEFEGVMGALARIGAFTYMIEATRLFTAGAVDLKIKPTVASAIAKCHLTELSRKVNIDAMDIHAGRGIQGGPRNYLATSYLAAPMSVTVEGANIMTRNLIIYGQGVIRCHQHLKAEIQALSLSNIEEGSKTFFTLLMKNIKSGFRHSFVSLWYGLTGGKFIKPYGNNKLLKIYYPKLTRMSTALAYVTDLTLLSLGGQIKRKEFLSARLGDVLSHLYLASAVIKYFSNNNYDSEDEPYVEWNLQYCLHQIQIAFDEFFANFPIRWLSHVIQWKIFPWGNAYKAPKDQLSEKIAIQMQKPSKLRDRLTQFSYHNSDPNDPVGRMDYALQLQSEVESIEKKIMQKEALSETEKNLWQQFEKAVSEAIRVDVF